MWCIVNLPNGTQQAVKWDPKAIGQECLEKVGSIIVFNNIIFISTNEIFVIVILFI